jgi:CrcB protein
MSVTDRTRGWRAVATIAGGGLVGSAARAGIVIAIPARVGSFPTAILVANLAGSFLLGLYLARRERSVGGPASMRFWAIGVLGSFTTFSTFSVDLVVLLRAGPHMEVLWYVAASLLGGLFLAVAGQRVGEGLR